MTTEATEATEADRQTGSETDSAIQAFAERVFTATLGSQQMMALYLGDRLGWYQALADQGPLTSTELAQATGTSERYAREWLEHQAVCGWITAAADGAYRLPEAHAEVLLDTDSLAYLAPLSWLQAAAGQQLQPLLDAYRTGGGVSWAQLGDEARLAQAALNRPMFLHQLTQELLPAVPELHDLLVRGARIADLGCGEGWSSIGLALGHPSVQVDGFDVDAPSIDAARQHASRHGVQDRVRFAEVDATGDIAENGSYDVVFAFECVHDTADPAGFLRTMHELVRDGGWVVVADERTEDDLATSLASGSEVEQLLYGWSLTVCLPDGMSTQPSAGTGTVMRPSRLAEYAAAAGLSAVEVLPIEHELLRFYRLKGTSSSGR